LSSQKFHRLTRGARIWVRGLKKKFPKYKKKQRKTRRESPAEKGANRKGPGIKRRHEEEEAAGVIQPECESKGAGCGKGGWTPIHSSLAKHSKVENGTSEKTTKGKVTRYQVVRPKQGSGWDKKVEETSSKRGMEREIQVSPFNGRNTVVLDIGRSDQMVIHATRK